MVTFAVTRILYVGILIENDIQVFNVFLIIPHSSKHEYVNKQATSFNQEHSM